MKTSLCLFTDSLEPSGLGEVMLTLGSELRRQYRVSFVCPPTPSGIRLLERARHLSLNTLALEVRGDRTPWTQLISWLRTESTAVLHVHAAIGWEGHNAVFAGRAALTPLILRTEHLPNLITDPRQRAGYSRMAQFVDRIICVCAEGRTSFIEAGIAAAKLSVIHNGIHVRTPDLPRSAVRASFHLPPGARLILTVARLTEQKGHRYLLEAIPQILSELPNTYFLCVCDGPLSADLREHVKSLGLSERVFLLGKRNDVSNLMAASDLFVLPSLFEGLPIVVLEAMSVGLPVVSTNVCGVRKAIQDDVHGRLVRLKDASGLAAAILEALRQPELTARWAAAAKARLLREFSAAKMAVETATLYERLLEARAARQKTRAMTQATTL